MKQTEPVDPAELKRGHPGVSNPSGDEKETISDTERWGQVFQTDKDRLR